MYTFSKSERLCNKTSIQNLFLNGQSISEDFIRLVYFKSNQKQEYLKSQIVVPKKNGHISANNSFTYSLLLTDSLTLAKLLAF